MGAINYKTSDYITMGINPGDVYAVQNDPDFIEEMQENVKEYGGSLEDEINFYINNEFEELYNAGRDILNNYDFYYYHVKIEGGYYEGCYIDIENNYGVCYDSYEDRREANKEITQIKKMLFELLEAGFVACYPGWCTGYDDHNETRAAIAEAIKVMRNEAANIPTWNQYERATA